MRYRVVVRFSTTWVANPKFGPVPAWWTLTTHLKDWVSEWETVGGTGRHSNG